MSDVQAALATLRKSRPLFSVAYAGFTAEWDAALATVEQALTDKDADREAAWENLAEMRERVARLTAELDEALAMLRRQHEGRVTSEAEVARLTAELDEARKQRSDIIATNAPAIRDLSNRAEAAEAEVARLRDALRGLLDTFPMDDAYGSMWFDYCAAQDAARAALGEEQ